MIFREHNAQFSLKFQFLCIICYFCTQKAVTRNIVCQSKLVGILLFSSSRFLIQIFVGAFCSVYFQRVNNVWLDFLIFSVSLFALGQLAKVLLTRCSNFLFLFEQNKQVSSTNKRIVTSSQDIAMSLIYIKKSKEPKTLPWCTPQFQSVACPDLS